MLPVQISRTFVGVASTALVLSATSLRAQDPTPDHVVVVIEENHNYNEIIGSPQAPYINSLASGGALFTNSQAVEHPSQPNYLDLFSGANQGVAGDNTSPLTPFTTPNLGAGLFSTGHSFADYSESLPSVGFLGDSSSDNPNLNEYMRKHNPASNWQSANPTGNQLPAAVNQPFSAFPTTNFSTLPTVSFVIPNEQNDMHDGTVQAGDTWLSNNISSYAAWAKTHNSLLIVTFDENDDTSTNPDLPNHITTIFSGANVVTGQYSELINHFNVLSTIESFYGVPAAGASAAATPITDAFVPEPGTVGAMLAGGAMIALVAWRQRRRSSATF